MVVSAQALRCAANVRPASHQQHASAVAAQLTAARSLAGRPCRAQRAFADSSHLAYYSAPVCGGKAKRKLAQRLEETHNRLTTLTETARQGGAGSSNLELLASVVVSELQEATGQLSSVLEELKSCSSSSSSSESSCSEDEAEEMEVDARSATASTLTPPREQPASGVVHARASSGAGAGPRLSAAEQVAAAMRGAGAAEAQPNASRAADQVAALLAGAAAAQAQALGSAPAGDSASMLVHTLVGSLSVDMPQAAGEAGSAGERPATRQRGPEARILVCQGQSCRKRGAREVLAGMNQLAADHPEVQVVPCNCMDKCGKGPNVRVRLPGRESMVYGKATPANMAAVYDAVVVKGEVPV